MTGIGGTFGFPNVETTSRIDSDGVSLVAEGTDADFSILTLDIDGIVLSKAGIILGFDTGEIGGVRFSFDTVGINTNSRLSQTDKFKFTPATVQVKLEFSRFGSPYNVTFQVLDGATVVQSTTTAAEVTYSAGQTVEITAPADKIDVTPEFTLPNTFSHDATTTFVQDLELKVGELIFQLPSVEIFPGSDAVVVCGPSTQSTRFW